MLDLTNWQYIYVQAVANCRMRPEFADEFAQPLDACDFLPAGASRSATIRGGSRIIACAREDSHG